MGNDALFASPASAPPLSALCPQVLSDPADLPQLASTLHDRLLTVLNCQVSRLDTAYAALAAAGKQQGQQEQEGILRTRIAAYFGDDPIPMPGAAAALSSSLPLQPTGPAVLQAAGAVLRRNREQDGPDLRPHAVARILHGLGSPAFPAIDWRKRMGAFWGQFYNTDFAAVLTAAEIAARRALGS
jgi:ATP-dependent DNA helicase Q4